MEELDYGAVFVSAGRLKGRILYYDDDNTSRTAICYVGHPMDFCGTFDVPKRFLRVPTVDELLKRREDLWRILTDLAIHNGWQSIEPTDVHALWAEKSLVENELTDRRLFGSFEDLDGATVFLCHSSRDKGIVRMIHDDLKSRKINCWLDENKIKVGDSIVAKISDGLKTSPTMILFLSPESVKSPLDKERVASILSTPNVRQ